MQCTFFVHLRLPSPLPSQFTPRVYSPGLPWNEPSFFCCIHVRRPQTHHFQKWGDCFPAIEKLEIFLGWENTCLSLYATACRCCCRTSLSKNMHLHLLFCRNFNSIDFYARNSLHTTEVYALCLEHAPLGRDHAGSLAALSPYGRAIENHSQRFHGSNWHVLITVSHSTPLFSCTDQPLPSHFPPQKGRPIPGRLETNLQAPLGCLHTTRRQRKAFPAW